METFDTVKYHKDVEINRNNLEDEICTTPAKLAYYIEQAALWNEQARAAKILRDNRASELYVGLKTGRIESEIKVTDGYIEAVQKLDENYKLYDTKYAKASVQAELYSGAVTAIIRKIDNLRSLNKNSNAEQATITPYSSSGPEERSSRRERVVAAQS